MKVQKRDGSLQSFNINKIKLTLERVSDEVNRPLTGSDIRRLTKSIEETVFGHQGKLIKSTEIHKIVVGQLKKLGFNKIAEAYDAFEKGF